jgi:hypothetical protein
LPIVVRATSDESFDVVQAYEDVVRAGAQLVIGPLTRSAVTALAGTVLVTVPTLALSAPEARLRDAAGRILRFTQGLNGRR